MGKPRSRETEEGEAMIKTLKLEDVKLVRIIVEALSGAQYNTAIEETIAIAAKFWVNVELRWADKRYLVHCNGLISAVKEITEENELT